MSYGLRQAAGGVWEVYEGRPEGGLTLAQALARGRLVSGWGREDSKFEITLHSAQRPFWWSLPALGTVEGGRVESPGQRQAEASQ